MTQLEPSPLPRTKQFDRDANLVTCDLEQHPASVGTGASIAGAAAGVAVAAFGGSVGEMVEAVTSAFAGGLTGNSVTETFDPTKEEEYWRDNFPKRLWYDADATFDDYESAYRFGWESRLKYRDRKFADVEQELSREWHESESKSHVTWDQARFAARDAWDHSGQRDSDLK